MTKTPICAVSDNVVVYTTDGRQYPCDTASIYDKYVLLKNADDSLVRWLNMSVVRSITGMEIE